MTARDASTDNGESEQRGRGATAAGEHVRDRSGHSTPTPEARGVPTRHLGAAVGLFVLAPLIGEYLLGNLPITWLGALPVLALLYGGGALLIRESARQAALSWPGIVGLGVAYAVIEEAFVTQSLFNPDYLGLRLLDYGYLPGLRLSAWWTVFVVTLHAVWSTAVPIALAEAMTPAAPRTPWLGRVGLTVTTGLFLAGCVVNRGLQEDTFRASTSQLVWSAVAVVVVTALAVKAGRADRQRPDEPGRRAARSIGDTAPSPRLVGAAFLVLGSAFMGLAILVPAIPAALNVVGMLGVLVAGGGLLWRWSQRSGWSAAHTLAVAAGLVLTYTWYGFVQIPSVGAIAPNADAAGNALLAAGAVALLVVAKRRVNGPRP